MSCVGCVDAAHVAGLLSDAQGSLTRAQFYLRPTVRPEPRKVTAMRDRIAGLYRQQMRLTERLYGGYGIQNPGLSGSQPALGLWPAIAVGAASLITAIGAWAWKHREEAREVELRSEVYNRMLEEGLSPERAAALAFGADSGLSDAIRKLTTLSLVGAGIYLALKFLK